MVDGDISLFSDAEAGTVTMTLVRSDRPDDVIHYLFTRETVLQLIRCLEISYKELDGNDAPI